MRLTFEEMLGARRVARSVWMGDVLDGQRCEIGRRIMEWCATAPVGVEFQIVGATTFPKVPEVSAIVTPQAIEARKRRLQAIE